MLLSRFGFDNLLSYTQTQSIMPRATGLLRPINFVTFSFIPMMEIKIRAQELNFLLWLTKKASNSPTNKASGKIS